MVPGSGEGEEDTDQRRLHALEVRYKFKFKLLDAYNAVADTPKWIMMDEMKDRAGAGGRPSNPKTNRKAKTKADKKAVRDGKRAQKEQLARPQGKRRKGLDEKVSDILNEQGMGGNSGGSVLGAPLDSDNFMHGFGDVVQNLVAQNFSEEDMVKHRKLQAELSHIRLQREILLERSRLMEIQQELNASMDSARAHFARDEEEKEEKVSEPDAEEEEDDDDDDEDSD